MTKKKENFLKEIRTLILQHNYYEVAKKLQALKKSGFVDVVLFDFIYMWQYFIQALRNNNSIDLRGFDQRLKSAKGLSWSQEDYDYVVSLYYLLSGDKVRSSEAYKKACRANSLYINFPVNGLRSSGSDGIVGKIKKIIGF